MDPNDFSASSSGKTILTPTGYWAFLPNPLPPEITWSLSLVSTLSETERELSRLSAVAHTFPCARLLIQPFMRSEAVISSRIEGTRASLIDLYTYESNALSFLEKAGDVREVYNYVVSMDYGFDRLKTLPVSLRLIRELHEKLMQGVRGGSLTPGEFRRSQNWIGPAGSTPTTAPYVPPPVAEMHQALDMLEKFIHAPSEVPHLIRMGMIHYQFEAIHPFLDGNGRVGRLLIVLLLGEWGLLQRPVLNLSAYIEKYRQQYYDLLLQVSQKGAWEEWLLFFLRAVRAQARDGVVRIEQLQSMRSKYQSLITSARNPKRLAGVIDYIFTRPVLSARQLSNGMGIPFKSANDALAKLEAAGILREITGFAHNRLFQAAELLQVFTR